MDAAERLEVAISEYVAQLGDICAVARLELRDQDNRLIELCDYRFTDALADHAASLPSSEAACPGLSEHTPA